MPQTDPPRPSRGIILVVAAPDFELQNLQDPGYRYWGVQQLATKLPLPSGVTLISLWTLGVGADDRERISAAAGKRKKPIPVRDDDSLVRLAEVLRSFLRISTFTRPLPPEPGAGPLPYSGLYAAESVRDINKRATRGEDRVFFAGTRGGTGR